MSKGTVLVLAGGLAGSAITCGMFLSGESDPRQRAPPQPNTLLGVDEIDTIEIDTMRHAMAGAWRVGLRAATRPEDVREPEVITVPAEKIRSFSRGETLIPRDRGALARELQRELARVGCYGGEINGAWTTSTRQAMKTFIERVNAALPTNHPDAVLLTLVRGHSGKACGAPCPSGQGRADTGRCIPTAILQLEAKRTIAAITGWSTTTTVAPSVPLEGQMGLAGPKSEISASKPKAKPVQLVRNSPIARQTVDRAWVTELWKKQAN